MSIEKAEGAPRRWIEFRIRIDPAEHLDLAAHVLLESGVTAVEDRDGILVTHEPWSESPALAAGRLKALVEGVVPADVSVEWTLRAHQDWVHLWKQGLGVRRIGRRVVVKPTWIDYEAAEGDVVIEIDPGMAFGTAEHATTRGCLELLDSAVAPGEHVFDVGTGSAILAIAASKLGASECLAVDSDPLAVDAARDNVARNHVLNVKVQVQDIAPATAPPARFDVVVANMISGLLLPRLGFLRSAMTADGRLIIGGIQSHERQAALAAALDQGLEPVREVDEDGWWGAMLRKASNRP